MTSSASIWRRLIAAGSASACSGLLVAGCGPAGSPAASSATPAPTVTVTTSPPGSPAAATTPAASPSAAGSACVTAFLQASIGRAGSAAGSTYYPVELRNISGSPCVLYGYPGVSFVTSVHGRQIGASASEDPARPRQAVTLAQGATASALLQVVDAANYPAAKCRPVMAHWLKVYPPGQFSALYIGFTAQTCSAGAKAVRVLSVGTLQPGKTGM